VQRARKHNNAHACSRLPIGPTLSLHATQPHPFASGVLIMATRTTISLLQLGPVIFGDTDGILSFLQGKGLLAQQLTCHRCSVPTNTARRASLTDGHTFRCPQCHTYTSLRSGSFFEKSWLPLQKWILLMYLSVREYPIKDAQEEAEVAHETAVSIYRWLREDNSCKLQLCWEGLALLSKLMNPFSDTSQR